MNKTESLLRRIFASILGVEEASLGPASSPDDIEAWDSLNHVSLMMAIEAECGVQFEPAELMELRTFGAILARVRPAVPS